MKTFYDWVLEKHLNDPPTDEEVYTPKMLALDFKDCHERIGGVNLAECPDNGYTVEDLEKMYLHKDDNTLMNYFDHFVRNHACENALQIFVQEWVEYTNEVRGYGRTGNH